MAVGGNREVDHGHAIGETANHVNCSLFLVGALDALFFVIVNLNLQLVVRKEGLGSHSKNVTDLK